MSVTQTVEFIASTGRTLTTKLYSLASDTVVATASGTTEATNRKGIYQATFTDVPAGEYLLDSADTVPASICFVTLTLATATFQTYQQPGGSPSTTITNNDKTGYTASTVGDKTGYTLSNAGVDALWVRPLTESYAASGAAPTVAQALFIVTQLLAGNYAIVGTTITVYRLDGLTSAATFQLNSSTVPTARTRLT